MGYGTHKHLGFRADGTLLLPTNNAYGGPNFAIRKVSPPFPGQSVWTFGLASEDGREYYTFDATGKHLQTQDVATKAVKYLFGYELGSGYLKTITDVNGNVTMIHRDAGGKATDVTVGLGSVQRVTNLAMDPDSGYLKSITDPLLRQSSFTYLPGGLLQTYTDANGGIHRFEFDLTTGRLTKDTNPEGGYQALSRTEIANDGIRVDHTTTNNYKTSYYYVPQKTGGFRRAITLPGITNPYLSLFKPDGTVETLSPTMLKTISTVRGDNRFGMQAPQMTVTDDPPLTTPGRSRTWGRSVDVPTSPTSPLDYNQIVETFTEKWEDVDDDHQGGFAADFEQLGDKDHRKSASPQNHRRPGQQGTRQDFNDRRPPAHEL